MWIISSIFSLFVYCKGHFLFLQAKISNFFPTKIFIFSLAKIYFFWYDIDIISLLWYNFNLLSLKWRITNGPERAKTLSKNSFRFWPFFRKIQNNYTAGYKKIYTQRYFFKIFKIVSIRYYDYLKPVCSLKSDFISNASCRWAKICLVFEKNFFCIPSGIIKKCLYPAV